MYREPKLPHVLCGLSFCEACHFVRLIPVTIIMLPKINLEHLELLRPWGPQIQLHGGPRFT